MKTEHWTMTCVFLLLTSAVFPETLRLGMKEGWEGTEIRGLRKDPEFENALILKPVDRNLLENSSQKDLDLLLLAEAQGAWELLGRYLLSGDARLSSEYTARGDVSLRLSGEPLRLHPTETALWAPGREWGDFTLEFHLRPTRLHDGETFFSWSGRDSLGRPQKVEARVERRRLVWTFHNFFRRGADRFLSFTLSSSPLIPGEWRHHRIRFKAPSGEPGRLGASPGLLEYLVDNVPVDLVHTTPDGREGAAVFVPRIGTASIEPLVLGSSFTGYVDELRLSSSFADTAPAGIYSSTETAALGMGRTGIIDTGYPASRLTGFRAHMIRPEGSRVTFFAAAGEERLSMASIPLSIAELNSWKILDMTAEPEVPGAAGRWYRWNAGTPIMGRYIRIGFVLDPGGDASPGLLALEAAYEPRLPPHPPRDLRVEPAMGGGAALSWSGNVESGVSGWWIYMGTQPSSMAQAVWVPRGNFPPGTRPHWTWLPQDGEESRIFHFSVRAAWTEGGPDGDPLALSSPSGTISFRP